MIYKIIIIVTSVFNVLCQLNESILHDEEDPLPAVIELAGNFTKAWDIDSSTLMIIDPDKIFHATQFPHNVAVITYSKDYEPIIKSKFQCDDRNAIEFHPTTMLIVLETNTTLDEVLEKHYRWVNYKTGTLLVLYSHGKEYISDINTWLKGLFLDCWRRNITLALIIHWEEDKKIFSWFTFNAFEGKVYNMTGVYDFRNLLSRVAKNLHNYPLRSCLVNDIPHSLFINNLNGTLIPVGTEGRAFRVMAKNLNISDKIVEPQSRFVDPFTAAMTYSKANVCDVLFTSTFRPAALEGMANIYPLYLDHWCVMAPTTEPVSGLEKFLMPFQSKVWYFAITGVCIVFIYWQVITYFQISWRTFDQHLTMLHLFGLLLNFGNHIRFHYLTNSSRILVIFFALYGFILTYAYQSHLFGYLIVPVYYKDLHTLREVGQSGLSILSPEAQLEALTESGMHVQYPKEFVKALVGIYENEEFLRRLDVHDKSSGYLLKSSEIEYIINKHKDDRCFYEVEECLQPMLSAYAVACNFPFSRKIEQLMRRLQEAGIYSQWKTLIDEDDHGSESEDEVEDTGPTALSVYNVVGIIKIWAIGIAISTVIFIFEFLCGIQLDSKLSYI